MELRQLYESIGTNYQDVLARFCNDAEMLGTFVKSFAGDCTYQELTAVVNGADYKEIESKAHVLKGVAANLGFERLQAACSEVVLCVRENRNEEACDKFHRVEEEYAKVMEGLRMLE